MNELSFAMAVLTLLAVPGPTNTLLAASGAAIGWRLSAPLLAAEVSGYLTSISLLLVLLGPILAAHPDLAASLKLAAALWVGWCSWRMARRPATVQENSGTVSFRQVLLTTLVNPKAVIFALVVFPSQPYSQQLPLLALFSVITLLVGSSWIGLGMALARAVTPRRVQVLAALALGFFAVTLAAQAATHLVASPTISDSTR